MVGYTATQYSTATAMGWWCAVQKHKADGPHTCYGIKAIEVIGE